MPSGRWFLFWAVVNIRGESPVLHEKKCEVKSYSLPFKGDVLCRV